MKAYVVEVVKRNGEPYRARRFVCWFGHIAEMTATFYKSPLAARRGIADYHSNRRKTSTYIFAEDDVPADLIRIVEVNIEDD